MPPTVHEILERHGVRTRHKKINCLSHDDSNPSCSVLEDYVYCHTCGWTVDAAGLEAKLSQRDIGAVLKEWKGDTPAWRRSTLTVTPPHELRKQAWLDWVEESQKILDEVKHVLGSEEYIAAMDEATDIFDKATELHYDDGDIVVPVALPDLYKKLLDDLRAWAVKWA